MSCFCDSVRQSLPSFLSFPAVLQEHSIYYFCSFVPLFVFWLISCLRESRNCTEIYIKSTTQSKVICWRHIVLCWSRCALNCFSFLNPCGVFMWTSSILKVAILHSNHAVHNITSLQRYWVCWKAMSMTLILSRCHYIMFL